MPKLVLFVACEKLIIDKSENMTIVNVLQDLTVEVPEGQAVPPEAFAPKEWDIVTLIQASNDAEIGKTFVQEIEIVKPDGKKLQEQPATVEFQLHRRTRNNMHIMGMPIGTPGRLQVKMWLHEKEQAREKDPLTIYDDLTVLHKPVGGNA